MFTILCASLVLITSSVRAQHVPELFISCNGSHYFLYQDTLAARGQWGFGGELGVQNIIPNIGLKLRGGFVTYDPVPEQNSYEYRYIPLSLCTSFNILPFLDLEWLHVFLETGFGLFWWKGLSNGEVVELPDNEYMDERDLGFVGGLTVQIRPVRFLGIEYATRFNYIASSDLYKYGFFDKDDKLWEHGFGLKYIIQF